MSVVWVETLTEAMMAISGLLFLARIAAGPTAFDRILALDGAALTLVGYLLFQGDRTGGHFYLDAALTMALLSFVATIALAQSARQERTDD